MIPSLTTERLILRQWTEADFAPFAALNADPVVMEHFPALWPREESDAVARRNGRLIAERGWGFWVVESKEGDPFLGFVGLHVPSDELPFYPCVEIGWRLFPSAWGRGIATEAARAGLEYGFETLGLDEIVAFTTLKNSRSTAVMERLGMLRDAATFAHPQVPVESGMREHYLYRITPQRWRERNAA